MGRIDWSAERDTILRHVRGFQPWPKAYTTINGDEIKILGIEPCAADWVPATAFDDRVAPGTIVEIFKGRGFVVRTGGEKGVALVTRVQPPGKQAMGAFDYVNGGGASVGTRLGT
jgi:methionyl-tRNA formyltransferase